jgi:transcriptional regulator with XRE-family HTH domain
VHESYCLKEEQRKSWKEVMVLLKVARLVSKGIMQPFEIPAEAPAATRKKTENGRFLSTEEVENIKASGITRTAIAKKVNLHRTRFSRILTRKLKVSEKKIKAIFGFINSQEAFRETKRCFTSEEKNKIKQSEISLRQLSSLFLGYDGALSRALKLNCRLPLEKIQKIMNYIDERIPKQTEELSKRNKRKLTESEVNEIKYSEFNLESLGKIFGKGKQYISSLCSYKMMLSLENIEKLMFVVRNPKEYEKITGISEYKRSLIPEEIEEVRNCSVCTFEISKRIAKPNTLYTWLNYGVKVHSEKIKKLMEFVESGGENVA